MNGKNVEAEDLLENLFRSKFNKEPTALVIFNLASEFLIGVRPTAKIFSNRTLITWYAGSNLEELSSNKFPSSTMKGALIRALLYYDTE